MKNQRDHGERLPQPDLFGAATQATTRPPPAGARPASARQTKPIIAPAPILLNVREAAARLGLSKSTLDKMRCAGKGPRFIKPTDRAVRYDPDDLEAWIAGRRRSKTSTD